MIIYLGLGTSIFGKDLRNIICISTERERVGDKTNQRIISHTLV